MNNFSVGYAEDLKNGCNSHGEAIILNPSRRDTTIIHYSIFNIHYSFKFQIAQQSDKLKFVQQNSDLSYRLQLSTTPLAPPLGELALSLCDND